MMKRPILTVISMLVIGAWVNDALAQAPATPAPGSTTPVVQGPGRGAAPAGAGAPAGAPGGGRGFAPVQIGPPAPVPPEVAIPRPTPAELEQVNAALKRLIAGDKSSAQPLLKKFEPLMLLQPPRLNVAATFTQTNQRMGARHEGFVEIAKRGNIDLLLHGDSITDWWLQDANKPVFDKYFGQHQDGQLRGRRRYDAGRPVGPAGTAKARASSPRP